MQNFTHFNEQGRAKMVNVGDKPESLRTAVASGRVTGDLASLTPGAVQLGCREFGNELLARI